MREWERENQGSWTLECPVFRNEHGQFAAWGNGKENDWGVAATTIGNILQDIDPDALIIGWSRHGDCTVPVCRSGGHPVRG